MNSAQWTAKILFTVHCPLSTRIKTSGDFLEDKQRLLYLAEVAKRSNCRPSELLELTGMPAYLLDCSAAETRATHERGEWEAEENVVEW